MVLAVTCPQLWQVASQSAGSYRLVWVQRDAAVRRQGSGDVATVL